MMPAAKHGDPQLGIDIHLCVVPPSPSPVPLPTPHTSIVFDPFDYIPYLGATVTVCGMKRATAGTAATAIHIPPGFPFAPKIPDTDDEIFMGSSTVLADGEPFSHISLPVLSCQVAGMISPPRVKKKGPPNLMVLPTTVNLAIPTSVVVGGPPTISLMGLAFKGLFAGLGKFMRSGLFKRMRQALFKNLDPGFLKCAILRAEPVNILTGSVAVDQEDFKLPGRIPLEWVRSYSSSSTRKGLCGVGWETIGDIRLEVDTENSVVSMIHPSKGPMMFERLPVAPGDVGAELELIDGALLSDHETEFQVRTKEDRIYHFPKDLQKNTEGNVREYQITRISDLCGNTIEFQRRRGVLTAIIDSAGRRLNVSSDDWGRMTEVSMDIPDQEAPHVFIRYEYNLSGDLVSVVDALDHPYTFAYENHHMTRHTDRIGLSFYYEYQTSVDGERRVNHAWGDGNLYNYQFEYVDILNERRITDSLGHVSIVKLNESGLPISEIDPLGGITSFEYDDRGRTTAVIDQEQNKTEYEYDDRGNLLKLTRPDGCTIETEFNILNKAIKIIDPNGAAWEQEWDNRGLLIRQNSPLGAETFFEYDARGQLIRFRDPLGAQTSLVFDADSNSRCVTDALGNRTQFTYDLFGNLLRKRDPIGQCTQYMYDAQGRLVRVILPSDATISCAYDNQDNLIRYVDENGLETCLEYFGLGEITKRIQPDGHTVHYHYDTEERLIGVTNQRGERFILKRDPIGRLVEEIDYWGQAKRYTYKANGYLKESIDRLGQKTSYETNSLGLATSKFFRGKDQLETTEVETFEYDANGNLLTCENSAVRIEFRFDDEGKLLEERQGDECSITNTYDPNGNRISRVTQVGGDKSRYTNTVKYQYDSMNQTIGLKVEDHKPLQINRDALGQVTQESLGEIVRREFDYSVDGYLTTQKVIALESPVIEQEYCYDRAGNLLEKHDSVMGKDQYAYDPLGHLISHLNPEKYLSKYFNDPAGDRLHTRITHQSQNDDPTSSDWYREGEHKGTYFRFNREGNLTERYGSKGGTQFSWDANQRLQASTTNGETTVYHYDPLGRRVSKKTNGNATYFFWDGDALLGDLLVNTSIVSSGAGESPNAAVTSRLREWVYYPDSFEPLAMVKGDGRNEKEVYLYHNDPNGCPTRLLDISGKVVWAAQNSAWGGVERLLMDQVDNPIRLQGQYEDYESGLAYNRYRYFDSKVGSYISQDPLRQGAGEALYLLAANIFSWVDPLGLVCQEVADKYKILRGKGLNPREALAVAKGGRYTPRSRAHLRSSHHHAGSTPQAGKGRFNPTQGGQNFTDEVIYHPNTTFTRQWNGRMRFDNPDLGRGQIGKGTDNVTPVNGGRVVLESLSPPGYSSHSPTDVVTQFPQ